MRDAWRFGFVLFLGSAAGCVAYAPSQDCPTCPTDGDGATDEDGGATDGEVSLSAAALRVGEGADLAFIVHSTVPHLAGVTVSTVAGTAIAGRDYTAISEILSVSLGDSQRIYVHTIDNAVRDGDRSFQIALSAPSGGAALGATVSATVTIVDDEPPPAGIIELASAWYDRGTPVEVSAYAGQATIPVVRRGTGVGAVSIHYATTSGGTATAGDDYTSVSGTLSWVDGDITEKSFVIPIVRDVLPEEQETIVVALDAPTGGAALGIRSEADVLLEELFARRPTTPVLAPTAGSTAFDSGGANDPSAVRLAADSYVMFFTGTNTSASTIGRAISTDGITWTKSPETAVTTFSATEPTVLFDSGTWHMWYQITATSFVGYATSTDGITWTQQNSGNPVLAPGTSIEWDGGGVSAPTVTINAGSFTMWYTGVGAGSATLAIGRATSTDGISWTKDGANPVLAGTSGTWNAQGVRDPSVIRDGQTYWMIFTGVSSDTRLGIAMSSDGVTWAKHPTPLMGLYSGAWDEVGYSGPAVLLDGEVMTVWYTGYGAGPNAIGRATNP